ncbi:uncharacterized protein LOC121863844 [Homarus americanus]|uniref:uncharacterized protein LOC121863844 n=1 Tax=Homarus americanus TaxID=6706 RepID=UPI001C471957|nr:uncharacterized protein LOC121863844 [Homarus americanus]
MDKYILLGEISSAPTDSVSLLSWKSSHSTMSSEVVTSMFPPSVSSSSSVAEDPLPESQSSPTALSTHPVNPLTSNSSSVVRHLSTSSSSSTSLSLSSVSTSLTNLSISSVPSVSITEPLVESGIPPIRTNSSTPSPPVSCRRKTSPTSPSQRSTSRSPSKSAISTLVQGSANTVIAVSGLTSDAFSTKDDNTLSSPQEYFSDIVKLSRHRDLCRDDLLSQIGRERGHSIYKNHVQQNHFLLVYVDTERDRKLGLKLRRLLEENQEGIIVKGPWNICLGDLIFKSWEELSESSRVVLVILSRALFENKMLTNCLPEILRSHRTVPLFLDPITPKEIPANLKIINHLSGSAVYEDTWNAEKYAKKLLTSYSYAGHILCEIQLLEHFIKETKDNPGYTCLCGNC